MDLPSRPYRRLAWFERAHAPVFFGRAFGSSPCGRHLAVRGTDAGIRGWHRDTETLLRMAREVLGA